MLKIENTEVLGWGACHSRYAEPDELLGEER